MVALGPSWDNCDGVQHGAQGLVVESFVGDQHEIEAGDEPLEAEAVVTLAGQQDKVRQIAIDLMRVGRIGKPSALSHPKLRWSRRFAVRAACVSSLGWMILEIVIAIAQRCLTERLNLRRLRWLAAERDKGDSYRPHLPSMYLPAPQLHCLGVR